MMSEGVIDQLRLGDPDEVTIKSALARGVQEVLPRESEGGPSLEAQMSERRIKLYLGIDPTSPDLHIGHTVPLRKLRHFQALGHEVVLLFGTFTGMIGDPTDKSAGRVRLTPEQIDLNVATYVEQAGKVLDLSAEAQNPVTIAYNHEWLGKLGFAEIVDLMSNFSVQQMMARSMFQNRVEERKPVWLHELTYPLMQGWDAVAMSVDLEVGGSDQTFNMLVGRDLVKRYQDREKWVLATKLIEDPNGKKMGKTEGNIVNIQDFPEWKYEAIMSWPDAAIPLGFELITSVPMTHVDNIAGLLKKGELHPADAKRALAYRVVYELDGEEAADYAEEEFDLVYRQRQLPKRILEIEADPSSGVIDFLVISGLAKDEGEAGQLIARRSVFAEGKPIRRSYQPQNRALIQVGKRSIKNIRRVVI